MRGLGIGGVERPCQHGHYPYHIAGVGYNRWDCPECIRDLANAENAQRAENAEKVALAIFVGAAAQAELAKNPPTEREKASYLQKKQAQARRFVAESDAEFPREWREYFLIGSGAEDFLRAERSSK